ncbi:hypothetical protein DUNSADRAFT_3548 [Dunaliella salina]|uniref:Encoded protein n=1 Tax=Dunaliella salina TaxID=3046 RepID=A0ABQ7H7X3_DUNSA|nr:hypothetical protein DUNSADRAFT_3548 [Dunaliella salina]|eukprot:KAF5842955.1 hypothetical protein DUNSADRAFT_3548 [Dunaliella salina]
MLIASVPSPVLEPLRTRPLCTRYVTVAAARQPLCRLAMFCSPKGLKLVNLAKYLNQHNSHTFPEKRKVKNVQQKADDVRMNLCRRSLYDPYRLSSCDVESLIDCLVGLHQCGITHPDLGMHALATMACFHDGRESGPPKPFRNSVR